MAESVPLGIHIGSACIHSAYVEGSTLFQLEDVPLCEQGQHIFWFREDPARLDYFSALDLISVESAHNFSRNTIRASLERVTSELVRQGLTSKQIVIAVPSGLREIDRRHLFNVLPGGQGPFRLIDAKLAAIGAIKEHLQDCPSTIGVVIQNDFGLEIALAAITPDGCEILACDTIKELSGRALNYYLLQRMFEQLPHAFQTGIAAAPESELTNILGRLERTRGMLGQIDQFSIPIHDANSNSTSVDLARKDVSQFFAERSSMLHDSIERLQRQTGLHLVDRVLVIGEYSAFDEFINPLSEALGPTETAPTSFLASGAALASSFESQESCPAESLSLVSQDDVLLRHLRPIQVATAGSSEHSVQDTADRLFGELGQMALDHEFDQMQEILSDMMHRCELALVTLERNRQSATPDSMPAPSSHQPQATAVARLVTSVSAEAQRYLDRAQDLLAAGSPLEAVGVSHLAYDAVEDHDVLMAMLEIHRRSATLLAGPENFEAARRQLLCALNHRRGDVETRQALARRLVEQALYLEGIGRTLEARNLLEDSLEYVDDESDVIRHLDRIGDPPE